MADQAVAGPSPLTMLPMLIGVPLIFYFIVFRPQTKARQEHEQMLKQLKKNDEVVTSGGILGTVVDVRPETVILRIDDTTRVKCERSAIVRVVKSTGQCSEVAQMEKRA